MYTRETGRSPAMPAMHQVFPSRPGRGPADAPAPDTETGPFNEPFLDTISRVAKQAGCELLFEIPAALFAGPASLSAAMRRRSENGAQLFFILFNAADGTIRIMEESEVGASVLEFTRSYAGVLGLIANDKRLITPLLQ